MKLVSALVGAALVGGVALSTGAASAMPATIPGQASQASNVEQADYVCNGWGHCWHRPAYGDGYFHPHYYGGSGWPCGRGVLGGARLGGLGLASRLGLARWLAPLASPARLLTGKGASAPFFFGDVVRFAYSKHPLLFPSN